MARLVDALAKGRQLKGFTCPITGIELEMRQPVFADRFAAETEARKRWGDAEIKNAVDIQSFANLSRALLIGRCLFEDGERIGEAILDIDENAMEAYNAVLDSIESPPAEEWSQDAVDGMIELIKKKDPVIAASLRISEGSMLYGLLHSMAVRLTSSPTNSSCSSSTGSTAKSSPDR